MQDGVPHTGEEQAILARLASAHKTWRDARPPPVKSDEDVATLLSKALERIRNAVPQPPDVEVLGVASDDPLRAVIWSQLTVVGWRLYAKGGLDLLTAIHAAIERDQHPGFAAAVVAAWTGIGFGGGAQDSWNSARMQ